jgi:hypothetical protein
MSSFPKSDFLVTFVFPYVGDRIIIAETTMSALIIVANWKFELHRRYWYFFSGLIVLN